MATKTVGVSWHSIYRRTSNSGSWKGGHSNSGNNNRYYHGGTSDSGGHYNGNMCTLISLTNAKTEVANLGSRVTSVKLKVFCDWCYNHASGASIDVCVGNDAPSGSNVSIGSLGYKRIHDSYKVYEDKWYEINIPVADVKAYKFIVFYRSGIYNQGSRYTYFNVHGGNYNSAHAAKLLINYNPAIIPGKPSLSLSNNALMIGSHWLVPEANNGRNYKVMAGTKNIGKPGSGNIDADISLTANKGSNTVSTQIYLDFKRYGQSWTAAAGFPKTADSISRNFNTGKANSDNNYNSGDRYGNGKVYWSAWVVAKSSTGHTTKSDYNYFVYNDCPYPSGGLSCSTTASGVKFNLNTVNPGISTEGKKYHYVMYQVDGGAWKTPGTYNLLNHTSKDYTWSELGISEGSSYRFCTAVGDSLEWNNHVWSYTSTYTRAIIPTKPTLTLTTSNGRKGSLNTHGGTWVVYPGWDIGSSPGSSGVNTFYLRGAADYGHGYTFFMERHTDATGWKSHASWSGSSHNMYFNVNNTNAAANYNSSERHPHSRFRVCCHNRTSTGNTAQSDWHHFVVNDAPCLTNAYVNVSGNIATVEWTWTDGYYDGLTCKIAMEKKRGNSTTTVWPSTNEFKNVKKATFNLDNLDVKSGDKISFKLRVGDHLEWNELQLRYTNEVLINTPPSLTGSVATSAANYNGYFGGSVQVSWPAAIDPNGDSLTYKLRIKIGRNGSYTDVTSTTSRSYSYNTSAINHGSEITFAVQASDPYGGVSEWIYSPWITKSSKPPKPTGLNIQKINYNGSIVETIGNLSWNKVIQSNGWNAVSYKVFYCSEETKGSYTIRSATTTANLTPSNYFGSVIRGGRYKFKVTATDSFGYESDETESAVVVKNIIPSTPTSFRATEQHTEIRDTCSMIWNRSADEDTSSLTYSIEFSENQGLFREIAAGIRVNTYTHNVGTLRPGTKLAYRVRAKDRHGIYSGYANMDKNNVITINIPPEKPAMLYPQGPIYADMPRICFRIGTDRNNHLMSAHLKVGGITYSSNNSVHRQYFNKREYRSGEMASFILDKPFGAGSHPFEIKTKDHLDFSPVLNFTYVRKNPSPNLISGGEQRLITSKDINNLSIMINTTYEAYRIGNEKVNTEDLIRDHLFYDLQNKIKSIQTELNSKFPGLNRIIRVHAIGKGVFIKKDIFNSILEGVLRP